MTKVSAQREVSALQIVIVSTMQIYAKSPLILALLGASLRSEGYGQKYNKSFNDALGVHPSRASASSYPWRAPSHLHYTEKWAKWKGATKIPSVLITVGRETPRAASF